MPKGCRQGSRYMTSFFVILNLMREGLVLAPFCIGEI